LQNHYASNIDFSEAVFMNCHRRLFYFYRTIEQLKTLSLEANGEQYVDDFDANAIMETFHSSMSNDFNTAKALGDLSKDFKKANDLFSGKRNQLKKNTAKAYLEVFSKIGDTLGLFVNDPAETLNELKTRILPRLGLKREELEKKIEDRNEARRNKDFATSDLIRDELLASGIEIMDTPEGTDWGIHYRGED
jgi:cysteinyl-tRNA synthetase